MSSIDKPTDNFNKSLKSLINGQIFSSRTSKFFQHRLPSYNNNNNFKNATINLPLKDENKNENNNNNIINNNNKKISIITKDDPIINDKEKIKVDIDDKKQIFNKISTKNLPSLQEEIKPTKSLPSQEEINILFLQELLQDFEKVLTITEDFKGFDKYATDWMKNYIQENMKKTKTEYIFEALLNFYQERHLQYFSSLLGFFYQYGIGSKINKRKALELYKSATLQNNSGKYIYNHLQNINNSVGKYLLALYYYKDIIVDKQSSLKWSYKSAKKDNPVSQYEVGYCYENGIGTIQSDKKAFEWYMKSAIGGNSKGQCSLAWCYQQGIGVDKDDIKSFEWYLRSAEGGNMNGQCNVAYYYENGIGTEKDEHKAFEWYEKSALNGSTFGQNSLGYFYEFGIGTVKDPVKAIDWYTKSAKKGNNIGQFNLGRCYHDGIGIEKDIKKAYEWLLKSAKAGNQQGQLYLEKFFHIKMKP